MGVLTGEPDSWASNSWASDSWGPTYPNLQSSKSAIQHLTQNRNSKSVSKPEFRIRFKIRFKIRKQKLKLTTKNDYTINACNMKPHMNMCGPTLLCIYIYLLKKKRETRKANDALVVLAGTRKESLSESTQNSIKN